MAQGIFNAGLLATEAGTAGRFAGNIVLTTIGEVTGVTFVEQIALFGTSLFGVFTACIIVVIAWVLRVYSRLQV